MTVEDERWEQHRREHELLAKAVEIALSSREKALLAALDDHHREHVVHESAHAREHTATEQALNKAEFATEKRFEGVNEFREQLRAQAATFATRDLVDQINKDTDRRFIETAKSTGEYRETYARTVTDRFDAQGRAITAIEKGDVKQEGKGIGQAGVIAAIVGAVAAASGVIGLIVVIANLLTSK